MAVEFALMESLENRQLLAVAFFHQSNLVSDVSSIGALHHDANLNNPWGLAAVSNGPWWVANNGSGTTTAYNGSGTSIAYTVKIPGSDGVAGHGRPTGIVANETSGFVITKGASSQPAEYVFVGEDGVISGWNINVDQTNAISMFTAADGAIYKGVTTGVNNGSTMLYAADFHNNKIDVFDNTFAMSNAFAGKFSDTHLPAGYAPFNIANIGGKLYVAYAKQDADKEDEVAGAGKGFVDVFNTAGDLVKRLAHGKFLDAPWAMVKAPKGFGKLGNSILVGNFGSGKIAAITSKGKFKGFMTNNRNKAIVIHGLWGLAFGNGSLAGSAKTLYFAAGVGDEAHGLFGTLR